MDELLDRLKGMGLDDTQAQKILGEVRSFLDEKLPEPIASKLDGILSGDTASLSSLTDGLSGGQPSKGLGGKMKGLLGN